MVKKTHRRGISFTLIFFTGFVAQKKAVLFYSWGIKCSAGAGKEERSVVRN